MVTKLARCAVLAITLLSGPALSAGAPSETDSVLSSEGWFIAPGSLTFRAPDNGLHAPWIATWERIDVEGKSLYLKVLINCDNFAVIPFQTLDPTKGIIPIPGAKPEPLPKEPGSAQDRTAHAACSTFGYFT